MKIEFDEGLIITKKQFDIMVDSVIWTKEFLCIKEDIQVIRWEDETKKVLLKEIEWQVITLENMPDIWDYLFKAVEDVDYPTNY